MKKITPESDVKNFVDKIVSAARRGAETLPLCQVAKLVISVQEDLFKNNSAKKKKKKSKNTKSPVLLFVGISVEKGDIGNIRDDEQQMVGFFIFFPFSSGFIF